jgi:hypothetical protein
MKMKWSSVLAVSVLVVALSIALGSANGNATTFNWSITENGITLGSGSLDANPTGGGPTTANLVDAMSGTFNGQTVGLLATGAYAGNNNQVFYPDTGSPPAGVQLDFNGLGFTANGSFYNVYYDPNSTGTYSCGVVGYCLVGPGSSSDPVGANDPTQVVDFSLTTGTVTPLPAALPLFATGLAGIGLLGWRRKRKAQAV